MQDDSGSACVPEASHDSSCVFLTRRWKEGDGLETRGDASLLATQESLSVRDISALISASAQYVWDRAIKKASVEQNEATVLIFHIL